MYYFTWISIHDLSLMSWKILVSCTGDMPISKSLYGAEIYNGTVSSRLLGDSVTVSLSEMEIAMIQVSHFFVACFLGMWLYRYYIGGSKEKLINKINYYILGAAYYVIHIEFCHQMQPIGYFPVKPINVNFTSQALVLGISSYSCRTEVTARCVHL